VWKAGDRRDFSTWEAVPVAVPAWLPTAADGAQTARATIAGQSREIVFPSDAQRQLALRTLADWAVRPRLLKTSGIAQVIAMGGGRKQYQVLVDPVKLAEYGASLQEVEDALRANNVNHTGGFSVAGGFETPIRVIGRLGPDTKQVIADLQRSTSRGGRPPARCCSATWPG